jgi:long-chain acyl-CoA synthetase
MTLRTLSQLHHDQCRRLGPRLALRHKKDGLYRGVTWHDFGEMAEACAVALIAAGVQPDDRVGILSENRVEWMLADHGVLRAGAIDVPLHAPLSARQAHFQLADAGVRWLFVSNRVQYDKIAQIRDELPDLRGVVAFDPSGITGDVLPWAGFLQRGRLLRMQLDEELQRRLHDRTPDDLATIIYTSGTTGNPKGVMLTHGNLASNALSFQEAGHFGPDSRFLNWLPMSHIYARTVDCYVSLAMGVPLALAESPETVVANLAEIQPTNLSGVPRFYEKILAAVQDADPAVTGKRLRAIFGPRIDWLGSGGAPLPLAVAQAYQVAGLLLLQGYGLTESSPVISFNRKDRFELASVGPALPGVEIRVADDGELLTRGPHVMKGYWNNPQATAEAIVDGWLHTGDLAAIDDGFLTITGRKKELLVLSNGKKVIPSQIESLLLGDPCIDQVVVCGEGRNFLSALVVPHWANLAASVPLDLAAEAEHLAQVEAVTAHLEQRITQALREMAAWEQVKKFAVLSRPFSVANEELTVSLKIRRNVILDRYREHLDAIYGE